MSEYRTTATLTAEGTFVVPAPAGLAEGTKAEVTLRYDEAPTSVTAPDPIRDFYRWLEAQPSRPSTRDAEQAMVRELRDEWD